MRIALRWSLTLLTVLVWVTVAPRLDAQPPEPPAEEPAPPPAPKEPSEEEKNLAKAKELFFEGNALRKAGDYELALVKYMESRALKASIPNTTNAAFCLTKLGRYDEALELYEELLTRFRGKLTAEDQDALGPRMAELRQKVGSVDVQANVRDADLVIDGRLRAKLPMMIPVRVLPGKRIVRVLKDGYRPFEKTIDVEVGETLNVNAALKPLTVSGQVLIDDPALTGAEVFIDGAPVGKVPFDGSLEPGKHWFFVRLGDRGSAPQEFVVVKGQTALLRTTAQQLGPEMRITAVPPSAKLLIGEVLVGDGLWRGRLPVGEHQIEAREDGYFGEARTVRVEGNRADAMQLKLRVDEEHPRWGVAESGILFLDAFGGFGLAPTLGSGPEETCSTATCASDPPALGFLVGARGGYEFPFRLSLQVAGGYMSLSKELERNVDTTFPADGTQAPIRYQVTDAMRVSGPFAGAGLGYRLPFAELFELRAHVLVGAIFSFTSDDASVTAIAENESAVATVLESGTASNAPNLFVMPSLELGMRVDGFGFGFQLSAMVVPLEGPEHNNGEMRVVTDETDCGATPTAVTCAPGTNIIAAETAYSSFVMLNPGAYFGYAF